MRTYILLFISGLLFSKNIYSQSDNDAAMWGALIGATAIAMSIEDHKEQLENVASNYIFKNHPEYDEFRLQVLGFGAGGNTITDNGSVNVVPFGVTKLDNSKETDNRKLLLLFASNGWINQYGVDVTKLEWEFWTIEKWNKLLIKYTQISSPITISVKDNSLPLFSKIKEISSIENLSPSDIYIKSISSNKKVVYEIYQKKEDDSYEELKNLKLTEHGWQRGIRLVYPFYKLNGDDYIITSFDDSMKIFLNENSLGIFLLKTSDSILLSRVLINKINKFLNNIK